MDHERGDTRLSRITTCWELLQQARQDDSKEAVCQLIDRYGGAAQRYMQAAGVCEQDLDDLYQDFVVRMIGSLHRIEASQGRFRQYVKTILINLVHDHRRKQARRRDQTMDPLPEPGAATADSSQFDTAWRQELIARCWQRLSEEDRLTGKRYFPILKLRADYPDRTTKELAALTSGGEADVALGHAAFRKALQRARRRFAELMLNEVAESLWARDHETLQNEIASLGLMPYCRVAMDKRGI